MGLFDRNPEGGGLVSAISTVAEIVSSGGGGSALEVKDEGSTISVAAASIDFVGAGVTATNIGDAITVTIAGGGGGATVALDNLVSTNINARLVPNADATIRLGLSSRHWLETFSKFFVNNLAGGYFGSGFNSGAIATFQSGQNNGLNPTGDTIVKSGDQLAFGSGSIGDLNLETGEIFEATNANPTGNINIKTGLTAGAGARGKITLNDGSTPTVGFVWTSTNLDGSGTWQAPAGGAPGPDSIDGTMIRLDNDQFLRARNFADSADVNLLKLTASDELLVTGKEWSVETYAADWWGSLLGIWGDPALSSGTFGGGTKDHPADSALFGATLYFQTGSALGAAATGGTGQIFFHTGDAYGTAGSTGSFGAETGAVYGATNTASTGDFQFISGSNSGSGQVGGFSFSPGTSTTGSTQAVQFRTGNSSGGGTTGSMIFRIGSTSGTRGNFVFQKTGVANGIGDVWTATSVSGQGYWAPAPAAGDLWSDPVDANIIPGVGSFDIGGSGNEFANVYTGNIYGVGGCGVVGINVSSGILLDQSAISSVSWDARQIFNQAGSLILDWNNAFLDLRGNIIPDTASSRDLGASGNEFANTYTGNIYGVGGCGVVGIDVSTGILLDQSAVSSVNWDTRVLYNSSGAAQLAWGVTASRMDLKTALTELRWENGNGTAREIVTSDINPNNADSLTIGTGQSTGGTQASLFLQAAALDSGGNGASIICNANNFILPKHSADPTGSFVVAGSSYYNTTSNKIKFYNGTGWETVTSA